MPDPETTNPGKVAASTEAGASAASPGHSTSATPEARHGFSWLKMGLVLFAAATAVFWVGLLGLLLLPPPAIGTSASAAIAPLELRGGLGIGGALLAMVAFVVIGKGLRGVNDDHIDLDAAGAASVLGILGSVLGALGIALLTTTWVAGDACLSTSTGVGDIMSCLAGMQGGLGTILVGTAGLFFVAGNAGVLVASTRIQDEYDARVASAGGYLVFGGSLLPFVSAAGGLLFVLGLTRLAHRGYPHRPHPLPRELDGTGGVPPPLRGAVEEAGVGTATDGR